MVYEEVRHRTQGVKDIDQISSNIGGPVQLTIISHPGLTGVYIRVEEHIRQPND